MITKILESPYPIYIGEINNFDFEQFKRKFKEFSWIVILVDENTKKFCLPRLQLINSFKNAEVIELESGESTKSFQKVIEICKIFTEKNLDRNTLVVNLGGGVISDFGGFVASIFKRGLHYINIPTTLLSMVDASIGGKTGINFNNYKNQIGVFSNPEVIFIDTGFLKTLSKRELYAGYSEIIKYALILDAELWEIIKIIDPENIIDNNKIIKRSVLVKSSIVKEDPLEKDIRRILNFGHTIAHAFESYSNVNGRISLLHGEAVAIGIICETYISTIKNNLKIDEASKIYELVKRLFPGYIIDNNAIVELLGFMKQDKKNIKGIYNFTLLSEIGKAIIDINCEDTLIAESINFYNNLYI